MSASELSYAPIKSSKSLGKKTVHQISWSAACRKHGVAYVKRGDAKYEAIRATYLRLLPPEILQEKREAESKPENLAWKDCCKIVGVEFAKKGTDEYNKVMNLFVPMMEKLTMPVDIQSLPDNSWTGCCKQLGHSYAKKGTPAYDEVMKLFKEKNESQVAVQEQEQVAPELEEN